MEKLNNQQKDVWETVKKYTDHFINGRVDEFLECFHKNFSGWDYLNEEPINKIKIESELKNLKQLNKKFNYKLKPKTINIFDKTAVVHYSIHLLEKKNQDSEILYKGHYTDILINENGQWLLVGDHVSRTIVKEQNSEYSI